MHGVHRTSVTDKGKHFAIWASHCGANGGRQAPADCAAGDIDAIVCCRLRQRFGKLTTRSNGLVNHDGVFGQGGRNDGAKVFDRGCASGQVSDDGAGRQLRGGGVLCAQGIYQRLQARFDVMRKRSQGVHFAIRLLDHAWLVWVGKKGHRWGATHQHQMLGIFEHGDRTVYRKRQGRNIDPTAAALHTRVAWLTSQFTACVCGNFSSECG